MESVRRDLDSNRLRENHIHTNRRKLRALSKMIGFRGGRRKVSIMILGFLI